MVFVGEWNNTI